MTTSSNADIFISTYVAMKRELMEATTSPGLRPQVVFLQLNPCLNQLNQLNHGAHVLNRVKPC